MEIITQQVAIGSAYFWEDYSSSGEEFTECVRLQSGIVGVFLDENMNVLEWIYDDSDTQFVINCCHWANLERFAYVGDTLPVRAALLEIALLNDMRGY